jgi:hypothetical protein
MAFYADSTRCTWWWPCPHCGAYSSPNPNAARYMAIDYPDDPDVPLDVVEREARLLCPVNGCLIEDHHREAMNLAAYRTPAAWTAGSARAWRSPRAARSPASSSKRDTAGVWIVGAMSPFVIGGIGGLARAGSRPSAPSRSPARTESPRQVIVKQWGMPYSPKKAAGSVEAKDLVERAEPT